MEPILEKLKDNFYKWVILVTNKIVKNLSILNESSLNQGYKDLGEEIYKAELDNFINYSEDKQNFLFDKLKTQEYQTSTLINILDNLPNGEVLHEGRKKKKDPKTGTGKKPKGSGRRLYTDEDPSDTVNIKFRTKEDIVDTLNKASFKAKSHARQSQIINLIHQRVRAAYQNAKDPDTKARLKRGLDYITKRKEASKEKTKRLQAQKEGIVGGLGKGNIATRYRAIEKRGDKYYYVQDDPLGQGIRQEFGPFKTKSQAKKKMGEFPPAQNYKDLTENTAPTETQPKLSFEERLEYYKNYYTNVSPSTFDITSQEDAIVIKGIDKPYPPDFNDVEDTRQVPVNENVPDVKDDGKAVPFGSGYEEVKEGDTIEKYSAKGKKTGNLKQGTVRKKLGIKAGEKIPMYKIDKELARLRKKDKDKTKPGAQLSDTDRKYYKALNLAKTLKSTTNVNENATYSSNINIKQEIAKLTKHMLDQGKNILPLPKLVLRNGDKENAGQFLGKTAYYDPNSMEIVLYTEGRHPKDIVRSYAHEMIHHIQNLEDRLGNISTTNTTEDDHLDRIEQEAYLDGNMTFRNWTDSLNENVSPFSKQIEEYILSDIKEYGDIDEYKVDLENTYPYHQTGNFYQFQDEVNNIDIISKLKSIPKGIVEFKFYPIKDGKPLGFIKLPQPNPKIMNTIFKIFMDEVLPNNPKILIQPSDYTRYRLFRAMLNNNLDGNQYKIDTKDNPTGQSILLIQKLNGLNEVIKDPVKDKWPQIFEQNLHYAVKPLGEIKLNPQNIANIKGDLTDGEFKVNGITYTYKIYSLGDVYEDGKDFYNVYFHPKGELRDDPTGEVEGKSYIKILSTMYKIILDFIETYSPDYIGISSMDYTKNYHSIYNTLTKTNPIPGYQRKNSNFKFTTDKGKTGRFVVLKKIQEQKSKDPFGLNQYARELAQGLEEQLVMEGRYDALSSKLASISLNLIKKAYEKSSKTKSGKYLNRKVYYKQGETPPDIQSPEQKQILFLPIPEDLPGNFQKSIEESFYFMLKVQFVEGLNDYRYGGDAYTDDDPDKEPLIEIRLEIDPQDIPKIYSEIYGDLVDVIRHEIEHLTQRGTNLKSGKYLPPDEDTREKIENSELPAKEYFLLKKEIPAMMQGLYFKAKKTKRPYKEVVDDYLDKWKFIKDEEGNPYITEKDKQDILKTWRTYLPSLNLPQI